MSQNVNNYFPSPSDALDPQTREQLKQLWLRVNHLIDRTGIQIPVQVSPRNRGGSNVNVAIPAASDTLLQNGTYASAGDTQFAGTSVPLSATGVGFTISGTSGAGVIAVSNAAAARSALGIVLPTGVAAHTIVLAKITGGGANGSITWDANGWITAFVDPT